jgi:DNA ligase (NAD+)
MGWAKAWSKSSSEGFWKDIPDIYQLRITPPKSKCSMAGAISRSTPIIDAIEASKKQSLERLLFGLGIKEVGNKTAKVLASLYKNLDAFKNLTIEAT